MSDHTLITEVYRTLAYKGAVKSQTDFGAKLGITKGHISKLTTGREPLSAAMRQKLTDIFNVNPIWLATNGQQGTMFITDTPTPPIPIPLHPHRKMWIYSTTAKTKSRPENRPATCCLNSDKL